MTVEVMYREEPVYPEAPDKIQYYQAAYDKAQEFRDNLPGMLPATSYFGLYDSSLAGDYYSAYEKSVSAWLEELRRLCGKVTADFDTELQACQAEAQRQIAHWQQLATLTREVPI